jgi:alkylhydroperoxidase family enzyme
VKTGSEFSERLSEPRLAPVDRSGLTEGQAEMLEGRPDLNIYTTLAHHPELYQSWSPLGQMLLNNTSVSLRHREIAMLRMGWLCQAPYEWSQHARIAHDNVGMTDVEIHAIGEGAEAGSWSEIDKAVMRMAEELRYNARVSDNTWATLTREYSEEQVVGLIYTSLQYQLVSMVLNTLGIQLDPGLEFTLPADLPMPALASAVMPEEAYGQRVSPMARGDMSEEQLLLIPARLRKTGDIPNYYSTLARFPGYFAAQSGFAGFLTRQTALSERERQVLILRTVSQHGSPYEWAHHVPLALKAGLTDTEILEVAGDFTDTSLSEHEVLLVMAVTDLRREAFVTDEVYVGLRQYYSDQQIVEIVFMVGGYAMFSSVLNTLGVETESGFPAFGEVN